MQQKQIFYKSDFSAILSFTGGWLTPFRLKFWTNSPSRSFTASYDGTTYTNCQVLSDGRLQIAFDSHNMGLGTLMLQPEFYLTHEAYADGICNEVITPFSPTFKDSNNVEYNVILGMTGASTMETIGTLPAYYQKGDKGDKGDPGSDATVTKNKVIEVLGYTPASPTDMAKKVGDGVKAKTDDIESEAITGPKIASNAVTTGKIAPNTILSDDINTSAFDDTLATSRKLADAKIVGDKISDIAQKVNQITPEEEGTSGQVLTLNDEGKAEWADAQGGGGGTTISSVVVNVDDNTGTPSGSATIVDGVATFNFQNLKGANGTNGTNGVDGAKGEKGDKGDQGNSGYSGASGELEVVNNLTQGGATSALSAEQGKVLNEKHYTFSSFATPTIQLVNFGIKPDGTYAGGGTSIVFYNIAGYRKLRLTMTTAHSSATMLSYAFYASYGSGSYGQIMTTANFISGGYGNVNGIIDVPEGANCIAIQNGSKTAVVDYCEGVADEIADMKASLATIEPIATKLNIKDILVGGIDFDKYLACSVVDTTYELPSEYQVAFQFEAARGYNSGSQDIFQIGELSLTKSDTKSTDKSYYTWTLAFGDSTATIKYPSLNAISNLIVSYSEKLGKVQVFINGNVAGEIDIPENANRTGFKYCYKNIYTCLGWVNINNEVLITSKDVENCTNGKIGSFTITKRTRSVSKPSGTPYNTLWSLDLYDYKNWHANYFNFNCVQSGWIPIAGFKRLYVNHKFASGNAYSKQVVQFLYPNTKTDTAVTASSKNYEPFWIDVPKDANAVKLCVSLDGYVLGEADDNADFEQRKRISQIVDDRIRPTSGLKSVLYIGDSWTDGGEAKPWVFAMNDIFGFTTEVCVARAGRGCKSVAGGTYTGHPTVSDYTMRGWKANNGTEQMDLQNQVLTVERLMNSPEEGESILFNANNHPDVVVIAIGTNDGVDNWDKDTYADYEAFIEAQINTTTQTSVGVVPKALADVDCTNFAGAIYYACQKLYTLFPNTFIIFCTPPQANLCNYAQMRKGEQIKKVCHRLGIAVCDWYSEIGFTTLTCPVTESGTITSGGDMSSDGLHPSSKGQYKLGVGTAKAIMRMHPNYIG